ncbi:MAG: hypothetical protein M3439_04875, partial [Chloroflexota bacterium]|nr:hypothetical protein [Chloroflexota bacterium]
MLDSTIARVMNLEADLLSSRAGDRIHTHKQRPARLNARERRRSLKWPAARVAEPETEFLRHRRTIDESDHIVSVEDSARENAEPDHAIYR